MKNIKFLPSLTNVVILRPRSGRRILDSSPASGGLRMTGILLLTMVLALSYSSFTSAEIAPKEYERLTNQLAKTVELYRSLAKQEITLDKMLLRRDPLASLIDAQGNPTAAAGLFDGPVLQGIIRSEGFVRVLIDDQFYAAGDSFGPYTVREIRDDGIDLEQGASTVFVPLYPSQGKKGDIT